jgi:hypothetical protein
MDRFSIPSPGTSRACFAEERKHFFFKKKKQKTFG